MKLSVITVALCALLSHSARAELVLDDMWVRAMPPVQTTTAAYGTLRNAGNKMLRIDGASSPIASHTTLHSTVREGDRVRMEALPTLEIAPGDAFVLAPGGAHLMLMGISTMPTPGSTVEVCVSSDQGTTCAEVLVKRGGAGHH